MNVFDLMTGFIPLIVIGVLAFGIVRLVRRAQGDHPVDAAALTRQAVLYGLLYVTMILTASGAVWAFGELTSTAVRRDNRELAEALALVTLGLPVFTALLTLADHRLRRDEEERTGLAWSTYLTIASITALIGTMVGAYEIISSLIDTRPRAEFEGKSVITTIIWGAFFATHWMFLRLRHGIRGDLHLAIASLVGLVPLAIGQAGLLAVTTDRLYDEVLDRPIEQLRSQSAPWAALFIVGCAVWISVWLRQYESAPRTEPWYVLVLPIGALAGFVATLGAASRFGYLLLVWIAGDADGVVASDHFDSTPQLVGIGVTGFIAWFYHRSFLTKESPRTDVLRSYDYLLMAASLITGVIGALVIVWSLLDDGSTDRNQAIAGVTLLIAGGFTWSRFASHIVAHQTSDAGVDELRSPVRRSYLYATLGVGGLAVLIAGIGALQRVFEDGLDGVLGTDTLVAQRVQFAMVVILGGVLWLHSLVLRSDQRQLEAMMPPPPVAHWPSRIIVLGTTDASIDVAKHPGTSVEYWHRTDGSSVTTPPTALDIDQLEDALSSQRTDDVLVLLNGDTPTVIPFER
ncbi:MAG: DUF5671 domain-containing protein [Acidimicrobiia bacterium]|nr:DUF5671 domain-containing protein [Acidimicrobiia bacterium]